MIRTAAIVLGIAGLLAAVPTAALASPGQQIGFGSAKGTRTPIVAAAASKAAIPSELRVRVESDPALQVRVKVTVACMKRKGSAVKTGSRTADYTVDGPPDTRRVQLALKQPDSCRISAAIRFADSAQPGMLKVTLFARQRK
jgi:hypothetical protein